MKKVFFITVLLLLTKSLFSQVPPPSPTPLDSELIKQFRVIDIVAKEKWKGKPYCNTAYSVELFPSNSDLGPALLKANAIQNVTEYLTALDTIRLKGVSISINYPVLVNSFLNSTDYLNYYKLVVKALRNKGLKILITCQASNRDTLWGKVNVESFYSGLTSKRYKEEKLQMLQTIIDTLNPDFLTIENEPEYMAYNTGLIFSVDSVMSYANYFAGKINKKTTKIGAGTSSWEDLNYVQNLSQIQTLDYIDLHISRIYYNDFYYNATRMDTIAKQKGKEVIIGDSWLYKISKYEIANNSASTDSVLTRNVYDTFFSVDSFFVQSVYKLSNIIKSQFTCYNKPQYFFGYLKYDSTIYNHMPLYQIINKSKQIISQNISNKKLSLSGNNFRDLLKRYCSEDIRDSKFKFQNIELNVYPNPSNGVLSISLYLPKTDKVCLKISDINGKEVKLLLNEKLEKGTQNFTFDSKEFTSGIYHIILQTSQTKLYRKLIIMNQ